MTLAEARATLASLEEALHAYRHAMGVLNIDGETAAPKRSSAGRGQTLAVLGGVVHEKLTAPSTRECIDALYAHRSGLTAAELRRAELLKEQSDELALVPVGEYMAYQRLLEEAGDVWHDAKRASDFPAFAPYLEKIVDYNRRLAARKDASKPAYDVLLDLYEKGASAATLDPFFAMLRSELTPLILAVGEKPRPDASFLAGSFPVDRQRAFTDRVMALMGIDREDCAVAESEHPFTDGFNNHDVRITTHYYEDAVLSSLYSVIHEGGHAIYELGVAEALQGTFLAGGSSMGVHESQSRFYENYIGRSLPFCRALLPVMADCFPGRLEGVTPEMLYRAVNAAGPGLIRIEADELTYAMHVMVRYELEKALIGGDLKAADVPGEWNAMYKKYLGVDVPDDRRGALQDSHWSGGAIGYFPSYALGSAYGAQMLAAMERDIDVWGPVATGDLSPVTAWLREKIHRHGQLLTPARLVENACGGPFDPSYYAAYLKDKYTALYDL